MSIRLLSQLARFIPPRHRPVVISAVFGSLFPMTIRKLLPEDLDGFPAESIRVAIRKGYERRIDRLPEGGRRFMRVALPDNFKITCLVYALFHTINKFKVDLKSIPMTSYGFFLFIQIIHMTRELSYFLGSSLLQSNAFTARLEPLLLWTVPSDLREHVEASIIHRETMAEVETWQPNVPDEEHYRTGLEVEAWQKHGS